ncbi:MAG: DUF362 domain-containing protein [Deltaproteobacteria bacterium]|nr:DUF362 domain-containing protein [Deltaproteobacteria bacterium]
MIGDPFKRKKYGAVEMVPSSYPGMGCGPAFLDRPPLEERSEVALVRCGSYALAESSVREALHLLGGIDRFCRPGETIILKPNLVFAAPWEVGETTHPDMVAALTRIFKEAGAVVKILERPAFNASSRQVYEKSGIARAALDAGVDALLEWEKEEYIDTPVPEPRSFATVKIPRSILDADGFVDIPKLKNNYVLGSGALTLSLKSMLGIIPQEEREPIHRTPVDMAAGCVDIAKAVRHKERLIVVDGVYAMEGATHYGHVCKPGIVAASADPVAVEAVCHAVVGYHPLESPAVQLAMKDGLGTGDLGEIDILGERLQDVHFPFVRSMNRFVQKYRNVKEFFGGTCHACLLAMMAVPPVVDPQKRYAVISGTRAMVAASLADFDEVYLVGLCACSANHQFPGFMEKVAEAGKIVRMPTCPGHEEVHKRKWGGIYDARMLLSIDMTAGFALPDTVRPTILASVEARREGRKTVLK